MLNQQLPFESRRDSADNGCLHLEQLDDNIVKGRRRFLASIDASTTSPPRIRRDTALPFDGSMFTYQFGSLHHIALDFEFPAHEHLLGIALAVDQLLEVGIVEL